MEVKVDKKDIQAIIDTQVQLAVAKALGEDSKSVIESLVNAALTAKKNQYSRDTLLVSEVKDMINLAARESLAEWLDTKKGLIQAAVAAKLAVKGEGFIESVSDRIVTGIGSNFHVSASLRLDDE